MERWSNKIAIVTGASSGIGAARYILNSPLGCGHGTRGLDLAKAGMIVVALARREERLIELRSQLPGNLREKFHALKCDITDELAVKRIFQWVDEHFDGRGVHVLVNNAGVLRSTELVKADNTADMRATLDTNIMGVVYCTREAFNLMRLRGIDDGHVVIINSICGHQTPNLSQYFPSFNIYGATKHAITSMVETYRQEFLRHNTKIRITSVSPGAVDTEIFPADLEKTVRTLMPLLRPEDVSNAVLYAIAAPAHVQIHELIIKPVGEVV